jgi:1,4-alpha-glucan branching enzyme
MMKKQRSSEPAAAEPAEKIPVEFVLDMPQTRSVAVAGNFNNWDPSQTPLRKTGRGVWRAMVPMPVGRYEYRFVVDGQWFNDPSSTESTPNPFGSENSIKIVKPPTASSPLLLAPPQIAGRSALRSR